jgi:putative endonuclease
MARHNELGKEGEEMAAKYLAEHGYEIVERNWYYGKYEIDIIARKGHTLAFVEVKTRTGDLFGEPEDGVSRRKERQIAEAADHYIQKHDLDVEARFDIFSITKFKGRTEMKFIEEAFYPFM